MAPLPRRWRTTCAPPRTQLGRPARRSTASIASGEFSGRATKSLHSLERFGRRSARRCSARPRPSVTITCASAVITATLVPGFSCRWMRGLHVRRLHDVDAARVDHDQLRAFAQPLLHARGEHRVAVGRVGADDHDHVGLLDRLEGLRAGRFAERLLRGRSRWASGTRARRCRRCCCRRPRAPASAPGRFLRWCSATR